MRRIGPFLSHWNRIQSRSGIVFFSAALLAAAGCAGGNTNSAKLQAEQQEMQKLRDENKELPRLRQENEEVQKLRAENQEISRLRGQYGDLQRLRRENEQLRSQLQRLQGSPSPGKELR